ncbi:MAG: GumC family protein [Desulfobacterales bacterium]
MHHPIAERGDAVAGRYTGETRDSEAPVLSASDFLDILRRRKWSLILTASLIFLLCTLVALLLPPVYKSTATILIEEQEIPPEFVTATITSYAEQRIQVINQRIMSSTRLLEVINRFGLYQHLRDKATTEEIIERMRDEVSLEPISADVMDRRTGKTQEATIAFTLSFEAREAPATVQNVVNQLTSLLLEENLRVRERQTAETYQFLEDEASRLRVRLDGLEAGIADFKSLHMNELPELLDANVQTLDRIERSIDLYNEQLQSLKEREGYLASQLAITPREWDQNWIEQKDEDLKRLEALEIELGSLLTRYSEAYPDVYKTRKEIDRLRTKLDLPAYPTPFKSSEDKRVPENPAYVTLASQLSGTRAEINAIERQIANLEKKVEEYRRRINQTPRVEEEFNLLVSDRANTQAKYNELLQKAMEARVAQGLEKEQKGERFTLIDPARLPEKPSKPNRLAIVLLGLVLGIGAGVGFAALREYADHTVRKPDHLTRITGFPVLAGIPVIMTANESKRRIRKTYFRIAVLLLVIVAVPVLIHYFVMDLDLAWIGLTRKLGL